MERAGSPGSYDESLVLLTGRETTEEFMSLALALEEGSRMFYKKVGGLTSAAEAKNIFNTLAKVEARHKRNILQANRLINGATLTNDVLIREPLQGVMEGGIRIEDAIRFIKQQGQDPSGYP